MRRIILHATSFKSFWAHYYLYEDNSFYEEFAKLGYQLLLSNQTIITNEDYILFVEARSLGYFKCVLPHLQFSAKIRYLIRYFLNKFKPNSHLNLNIYKQIRKTKTLHRTLLLIFEGKIDAPENHSLELGKLCNIIFTWNDDLVDDRKFKKINWPQPVKWPEFESVPFSKKKLLTNISANKYSSNSLELYSLRRESILFFENRLGDQFDLYGIGWNEPANIWQRRFGVPFVKFRSYKGRVNSKAETFSKYRFALIYENAQVPGWITEKIFDCLRSECIPIYFGAPNVQMYIPSDIFIDRRKFVKDEEILNFILSMDEHVYSKYIERISHYLKSAEFMNHLSTALAARIVEAIERESSYSIKYERRDNLLT